MSWLVSALTRRTALHGADVKREEQARDTPWMPDKVVLEAVEKLVFDLALPQLARDYILACFRNGPSRRVTNRRGNDNHGYVSRKMNNQLQLESRRGEWAAAVLMDTDSDVICFLAQPMDVPLDIRNCNGAVETMVPYHPDFIVFRRHSVAIVQQRDLEVLTEAALNNPHQWYRDQDGEWHYRAADEAFWKLGLLHQVRQNNEIPAALVRNEIFLRDYARLDAPQLRQEVVQRLSNFIEDRRFCSLLQTMVECELTADEVNRAIIEQIVYVDLAEDRLDDTSNVLLFSDCATCKAFKKTQADSTPLPLPIPGTLYLRAGSTVSYEGEELAVVVAGSKDVLLQDARGNTQALSVRAVENLYKLGYLTGDGFLKESDARLITNYSKEELERAVERLDSIDTAESSSFGPELIRKFKRIIQSAPNRLEALLLLTDRYRDRGNRTPRVTDENRLLGSRAIEEKYNTGEGATKKAAYIRYGELCEENSELNGLPTKPVSYTRFCQWVEEDKSTKDRRGNRAAYQEAEIPQYLDNSLPIHGVRPHEVCYIDHTVLNLSTETPNGVQLHKPVLSVARDGNTTNAKALYIGYDKPSVGTVLMVLRDYVRRNGRLPATISVDNGKEFHSQAFKFFCWLFDIEIRWHPPGQPRGGAPIESLIGATEIEILAQAKGNTRILKDPRLVTKSVNPFRHTEWTLPAVYFAFEHYLFDVRANRIAPALGVTPNEFEARRIAETGSRDHVLVRLDENIMLLTAPNTRKVFRAVDKRRGVYVDGGYHWHPELSALPKGIKVEVRVEPWLFEVVYVRLPTRWVAAVRSDSRRLGSHTRKEYEIALREEARRSKALANKDTLSHTNAAKMRRLWVPSNWDPRINAQQSEMRYLYGLIGMGVAMPIPPENLEYQKPVDFVASCGAEPGGAAHEQASPAASASPNAAGLDAAVAASNHAMTADDHEESYDLPGYR
jgi:putative transposase